MTTQCKTKFRIAQIVFVTAILSFSFVFSVFAVDNTPPKISGVETPKNQIKEKWVTVVWNTDEPADSKVEYGTSQSGALTLKKSEEIYTMSHTITLTGLNPNTTYLYKVKSKDMGGNLAESGNYTFTTAGSSSPTVWRPAPLTTWQWQLQGTIVTSFDVEVYDIDLFDTPQSVIDTLHKPDRKVKAKVICYFSAGTWEPSRSDTGGDPYNPQKDKFPESVKGNSLEPPFGDEKWLDIRDPKVKENMKKRLDLAKQKHCDAVEPDNVDGYTNDPGFPMTAVDQLRYNQWLAQEAHKRGLSIGLKNDLGQVKELEPYFDWALNEQAFQYNEYKKLRPFIQAGKAVFGVEYGNPNVTADRNKFLSDVCPTAKTEKFSWLLKHIDLDARRFACPK